MQGRVLKHSAHVLAGFALLVPLICSTGVQAGEQATSAGPARFHSIVDLEFVEQYAVIPKRTDVAVIDSRPKARKYDKGHIPTAISIPDREFEKHLSALPQDKATLLIFYCGGQKCSLSHKSAFKAEKLGYTNVKVFADGFPAWKKAGKHVAVSTAYVKKLVDSGSGMIIDARPKARKFDKGHIPGAVSIPYREFDKHVDKLPQDKAAPLVFYCGGLKCTLSPKSADKARALGYTNVLTYPMGFPAWKTAYGDMIETGSKVAGGTAHGGFAIKPGKESGTISIASFTQLLEQTPDQVMVVDVRDPAEFKAGSFKTAVNIPIDDLEKKVDALPAGKPIVFICNSGALSGEAYDMVKLLRSDLQVYFLEAEISFKPGGEFEIAPVTG